MTRAVTAVLAILLAACGGGDPATWQAGASAAQADWRRWHGDKQAIDLAIAEKINAPGGGDYAGAIEYCAGQIDQRMSGSFRSACS